MSSSELADIRRKCVDTILKCADNVSQYLDCEKDEELSKLKACVQRQCELEETRALQEQALLHVERQTDESNLNTLDKRVWDYYNSLERSQDTDGHPFMMQFQNRIANGQMSISNEGDERDDADVAIVAAEEAHVDPLTKLPLRDPLRNALCGHVYERSTILAHIERHAARCPELGCGNRVAVLPQHLREDAELRARLSRR